ncbi:MAG: DUF2628 domain-containing protein [Spirochaetia bacterium]|nr:DUF2628 domain-containing protein [Spirochaetia bacterium]
MSDQMNPYEPPVALATVAPNTSVSDLLAFANELTESDYYAKQWIPSEGAQHFRPNFASLFVGANWLFYRKMYLAGLAFVGIEFSVSTVLSGIFPAFVWIGFVALPVVRLPLCAMANRIYHRAALRAIDRCPFPETEPEERKRWLEQKGGTRMAAVALNIVANMALTFGVSVLPRLLR